MPITADPFISQAGTAANPNFAQWVFRGTSLSNIPTDQPIVNVLHFVRTAGSAVPNPTNLMAGINAVMSGVYGNLSDKLVNTWTRLRFMDTPLFGYVQADLVTALDGTITGDRLPDFNSITVQKKTLTRGRSFRGSNHYGPVAESQTLDDRLTTAAKTLWDSAINTAYSGLLPVSEGTNSWSLCVLSQVLSDFTANPCVFTGAIVNDFPVNSLVGSMIRRKEKKV